MRGLVRRPRRAPVRLSFCTPPVQGPEVCTNPVQAPTPGPARIPYPGHERPHGSCSTGAATAGIAPVSRTLPAPGHTP